MKELQEAVINKQPLKVYTIDDNKETYMGIWKYIPEKDIYQGQYGFLNYKSIVLCSLGKLKHIKLELGE